jgi:hypothetical protein
VSLIALLQVYIVFVAALMMIVLTIAAAVIGLWYTRAMARVAAHHVATPIYGVLAGLAFRAGDPMKGSLYFTLACEHLRGLVTEFREKVSQPARACWNRNAPCELAYRVARPPLALGVRLVGRVWK